MLTLEEGSALSSLVAFGSSCSCLSTSLPTCKVMLLAAESDVAKALRTAGFPEVESKISPENVCNKVLTGIQKRLLKMDDMLTKLAAHPESSLIKKILLFSEMYI